MRTLGLNLFARHTGAVCRNRLQLQAGDAVVIEKAQGRWRLVFFRDPLSNQLSRAWVYHTALAPLADAVDVSSD